MADGFQQPRKPGMDHIDLVAIDPIHAVHQISCFEGLMQALMRGKHFHGSSGQTQLLKPMKRHSFVFRDLGTNG